MTCLDEVFVCQQWNTLDGSIAMLPESEPAKKSAADQNRNTLFLTFVALR